MFWFDPMYLVYVGPAILLAMWAQYKVKTTYAQASQYAPRSGLSGAETAQRILNAYGITNVAIEPVQSFLGDHYDAQHKVLRLSPGVYQGRSLAALGIAAHEVGHAIQDSAGYGPLAIRNGLVPMASIGSNISVLLVILGIAFSAAIPAARYIAIAGLGLFAVFVLFQLVNLPVEYNASARAKDILVRQGMVTAEEAPVVRKVLSAAALTYVAATLTAILTLLYLVFRVYGSRRD